MDAKNPATHSEGLSATAPVGAVAGTAANEGLVLFLMCLAVFMSALDMFVVNLALGRIGRDYGEVSLPSLSWILNGYTIVYGALLIPAGRLADRFGKKPAFLAGLALFTAASLACALAPDLRTLVLFRCLQALGAAILTPTSLGLLLTCLSPSARGRGVRLWTSSSAVAGALGPVIGGLLVDVSWRWIFLLNLPVGLIALAMAARAVPSTQPGTGERWPDLIGGVFLIIATVALAFGLVQAPVWGWGSTRELACGGITVAALLLFLYRTTHHVNPMIDLNLFRSGAFSAAVVAVFVLSMAFAAELLGVVLYLQDAWHWSVLQTGLAVAPGPCMVPIFAIVGQRLARRMPLGQVAASGAALLAIGPVLIATGLDHVYGPGHLGDFATAVLPGWLLIGIGSGLAFPTAFACATVALPPAQSATGSGVISTARQIGLVVGTSVLVLLLSAAPPSALGRIDFGACWRFAGWTAFVGMLAAWRITPISASKAA